MKEVFMKPRYHTTVGGYEDDATVGRYDKDHTIV